MAVAKAEIPLIDTQLHVKHGMLVRPFISHKVHTVQIQTAHTFADYKKRLVEDTIKIRWNYMFQMLY